MTFLLHYKIFKIFLILLNIIAITIGADDETKISEETIASILDHLKNGLSNMKYPNTDSHPNTTLVLGNSGSGKSTFVQYVFGDNSKLESKLSDPKNISKGYYISDNNQKISNSSNYSNTVIPELVFDTNTSTSIYDCPGFKDKRDAKYDISITYFIKAIADRCKGIKFVFVVRYDLLTTMGNRQDFISLAKHATDTIKNVEKFKDGICLVASRVNNNNTYDDVILTIAKYLHETRDQLKNDKSTQGQNPLENMELNPIQQNNMIKFIDALLATDANGNYKKIGFVKQPEQEGPLSGIDAMQKHKQSLIQLLNTNIQFVTHDDSKDFGYTIPNNLLNYVDNLINQLYQQLMHHINGIDMIIKQNYNDLLQPSKESKILTAVCKISTEAKFLTFLQNLRYSTSSANQWPAPLEGMEMKLFNCTNNVQNLKIEHNNGSHKYRICSSLLIICLLRILFW